MRVQVTLRGRITVEPEYEGEVIDVEACLNQVFERITDDLYAQNADEPMVAGSLASGDIEISIEVEAETKGSALDWAESVIRSALHAAEVGTSEWEADRGHLIRAEICEVATADALVPA